MNRVNLVGRLTSKPELRYTNSNTAYTRFNLAVNRQFPNAPGQREADFIPVVVWQKSAENLCKYQDKGSLISVEGRIQIGTYTDKDGNKKNTFDVVADNIQYLEAKKGQAVDNQPKNNVDPYSFQNDVDPYSQMGDMVEQTSINLDDCDID